jgi:hypothetical protein
MEKNMASPFDDAAVRDHQEGLAERAKAAVPYTDRTAGRFTTVTKLTAPPA